MDSKGPEPSQPPQQLYNRKQSTADTAQTPFAKIFSAVSDHNMMPRYSNVKVHSF